VRIDARGVDVKGTVVDRHAKSIARATHGDPTHPAVDLDLVLHSAQPFDARLRLPSPRGSVLGRRRGIRRRGQQRVQRRAIAATSSTSAPGSTNERAPRDASTSSRNVV